MLGPRFYALAEKMGADRMAGLVERLKYVKHLKESLRELDVAKSVATEKRETKWLNKDTAAVLTGEGTASE